MHSTWIIKGIILSSVVLEKTLAYTSSMQQAGFGRYTMQQRHLLTTKPMNVDRNCFQKCGQSRCTRYTATPSFTTRYNEEYDAAASSNDEKNKKKSKSIKTQAKEDDSSSTSGLRNALIMGPPLFLKFCVVLIVKFLTDVIIFPLLFLYRILRLMKVRIFLLFRRGEKTNESGTSNK